MKNRSIPYNWITCKLKDIGSFYRGKGISSQDIKDEGLPAIMYGDIYVKYNIKFKYTDHKIDEITATKSTKISKGTLLFTSSGETAIEIGKCVVYLGDEDIYIGGDIIALKPKECYNSLYLSYLLNSYPLVKQKARLGQGHSVVHIYPNILKELNLILPKDKEEQNKIANILSTWDNAIELKEKLIEQKKKQKKGLMQLLLSGKKRLKGFSDIWKEEILNKLVFYQEGPGVRNYQYCTDGVKLLNVGNLQKNKLILDRTDRYISEEEAFGRYSHFLVDEGDLIIACSGINAESFDEKIAFATKEHLPLCMNTSTMRFKVLNKNELNIKFLYYFFQSHYFKTQIFSVLTGSAQFNFGPTHLKYLKVKYPKDINEQNEIVKILVTSDKEIELLEKQLEELKKQKKGLMQLLLTGIVRVTD